MFLQGITLTSLGGVLLATLIALGMTFLLLAVEIISKKLNCKDKNKVEVISIRPAKDVSN
jgi:hypothetical protein